VAGQKVIKVGLDFDGVLTYNPFRVARVLIAFFKHRILKIKKLGFFVPKNGWQKLIYYLIIILPSAFPANGSALLKSMSGSSKYKFYLLTGRFDFTLNITHGWLKFYKLHTLFKKIYINENNEQPHVFKNRVIRIEKLDYYIEDNWDIVRSLKGSGVKAEIMWIYNILDAGRDYRQKFPFLKKALEKIGKNENSV
jgi:hypothetical protein